MFKIQTLNKISSKGLDILPHENYEHASEIINPDAILVRSQNMNDMKIPESVKAIARAGAGVNNIPVEKCSELGIVVFNTPGANANGVKELVIAGLFLTSRKIIEGITGGLLLEALDVVDEVIVIENDEAVNMANILGREEGLFCGISGGANVLASIQIAKKYPQLKNIVTVLPDRRDRYFTTERYTT